jgi:uracil-DNA glycosylase
VNYIFDKYGLREAVIGDVHGKSQEVKASWGSVVVYPLYHPAAAIYNRKLLSELEEDMKGLAALL